MEKILIKIASKIEGVHPKEISKIFKKFKKNTIKNLDIDYLKKELKIVAPNIFKKDVLGKDTMDHKTFLLWIKKNKKIIFLKMGGDLNEVSRDIEQKLKFEFNTDFYIHSHRTLNKKKILEKTTQNGFRGLTDCIGHRIVPKNSYFFPQLISRFEKIFKDSIIYKFNSFILTDTEFYKILDKNSSVNYKAIHYYININNYIVEVQLRMSAIDIWSKIHHATLYKNTIRVNLEQKKAIDYFGNISNIIDYNSILTNNYKL